MTKELYQIIHLNETILFGGEYNNLKDCVEDAVKQEIDLCYADLSNADLSGANLEGAFLAGADLSDANLKGANLKGACLFDVDLSSANLDNTNIEEVYTATVAQIEEMEESEKQYKH